MRHLQFTICFAFSLILLPPQQEPQKIPKIIWTGRIETSGSLKQAKIEEIAVSPETAGAWRAAGFKATAISSAEIDSLEKLPVPRIVGRANVASATRRPWIDANGWRFIRNPNGKFYCDIPAGKATIALAETFAYGADAFLKIDPSDIENTGRMLSFIRGLPVENYRAISDIGLIDDGSAVTAEVMNLLARRNLLFQRITSPSKDFRVNIKLGTKEFPESEASDPNAFAQKIRLQIGDENRSLRLYGSETVIGYLTGDRTGSRLHLLNYSGNEVEGLRVRIRRQGDKGKLHVFGYDDSTLTDTQTERDVFEATVSKMGVYAVIDLLR